LPQEPSESKTWTKEGGEVGDREKERERGREILGESNVMVCCISVLEMHKVEEGEENNCVM
jgi:hypothetical protein